MIKIENYEVVGFEHAFRGMRNPKNSWNRSDSTFDEYGANIGVADFELAQKLNKGGPVHAKYRRMITVYADVTSNAIWWAEFDTYKVGTVRNSCSKMHKIHAKAFSTDDFSTEGIFECGASTINVFNDVICELEFLRKRFNATGEKNYWRAMLELLPHGYNMRATIQLNYEVLANIYKWRKNHKMFEWREFCKWIESLPYSELITGGVEDE